jgi:hypothetical protein
MKATIHYASVRPIGHGTYRATVQLIVNDQVLTFTKRVTDMEMIDVFRDNQPLPLVNYVTDYDYEIKQ